MGSREGGFRFWRLVSEMRIGLQCEARHLRRARLPPGSAVGWGCAPSVESAGSRPRMREVTQNLRFTNAKPACLAGCPQNY